MKWNDTHRTQEKMNTDCRGPMRKRDLTLRRVLVVPSKSFRKMSKGPSSQPAHSSCRCSVLVSERGDAWRWRVSTFSCACWRLREVVVLERAARLRAALRKDLRRFLLASFSLSRRCFSRKILCIFSASSSSIRICIIASAAHPSFSVCTHAHIPRLTSTDVRPELRATCKHTSVAGDCCACVVGLKVPTEHNRA